MENWVGCQQTFDEEMTGWERAKGKAEGRTCLVRNKAQLFIPGHLQGTQDFSFCSGTGLYGTILAITRNYFIPVAIISPLSLYGSRSL